MLWRSMPQHHSRLHEYSLTMENFWLSCGKVAEFHTWKAINHQNITRELIRLLQPYGKHHLHGKIYAVTLLQCLLLAYRNIMVALQLCSPEACFFHKGMFAKSVFCLNLRLEIVYCEKNNWDYFLLYCVKL